LIHTPWKSFVASDNLVARGLCGAIIALAILFLGYAATLYLTWPQQLILSLLTLFVVFWMDRGSSSHLVTLTLVLLSIFTTLRYAYWRISTVIAFFRDPGMRWDALDAFFLWILLLAESYAFLVLLLNYLQMIWPLRRKPVPLPESLDEWPDVDLVIPTFDEPLSVVRYTALAAMNLDWPADKLHVTILDDGRREEFRVFAEEAGIGYRTREGNQYGKAGNINSALPHLDSPYLAIFDCDHVPTRSFLQLTMGWFLRDKKLAMLQTPHHFYSPDPFERNLDQFRVVPNEGELFHAIIQDGNDFWNATAFCGSCAVLRRTALDEIGGIATETVTEDAHTSLRMQGNGWNTAYINIPQAAGLSPVRLSEHVKQRIRWARGSAQILHLENPLFMRGLTFAQRICYFSAISNFLYALPRLIFLTAPLIYLIFGHVNIPGSAMMIVAYAAPYLVLSNLTCSRIQGEHRHSFWNQIYETVLSPYIFLPTVFALLGNKKDKACVTAKGGVVEREFFDDRIARPFLLLLAFNLFGLLCAIPRAIQFPTYNVPHGLAFINWPASIHDGDHLGFLCINVLWALFSVVLLGVATAVAWESQQRRHAARIERVVPSNILLPDGSLVHGITSDLSSGGARTRISGAITARAGDAVQFVLPLPNGTTTLPARVIAIDGNVLRARFDPLTMQQEESLALVLYSRADNWVGDEAREIDHPLHSMARILRLAWHGISQTFGSMWSEPASSEVRFPSIVPSIVPKGWTESGIAGIDSDVAVNASRSLIKPTTPADTKVSAIDSVRSIASILLLALLLGTTARTVRAAQSQSQPDAAAKSSSGSVAASTAGTASKSAAATALRSTAAAPAGAAQRVPTASTANDLSLLPLPFYDAAASVHPSLPIVFLSQPSPQSLRAAGIVASWLGILTSGQARFSVAIGAIPHGNAIVIAQSAGEIPNSLNLSVDSGPMLALRTNPSDPSAKLLLVAGANPDELVKAAVALAIEPGLLQGTEARIQRLQMPDSRRPDDAPRWLNTEKNVSLGEIVEASGQSSDLQTGNLQTDGSAPISVTLRLPPDLYYAQTRNLALHLNYRYNGIPLGNGSTLQVYVNGAYVSSTPMQHTNKASQELGTIVPIPVSDLRPYSNTILFKFVFQTATQQSTDAAAPLNLQGAILKDSYLDIAGTAHWAVLPDLELFANAGYPFTRKADLAETLVVLPDHPTTGELEIYLAMMGHFGAQTGAPVLNVAVGNAAAMNASASKDYLVIGTVDDQPALRTLDESLPVGVDETGLHIHDTSGFFNRNQDVWWRVRSTEHVRTGQIETLGGLPDALIEAFEWPHGSKRSVVAIVLRDSDAIQQFIPAFLDSSQTSAISQSLSVLHGSRFASYRIGNYAYRVGKFPLLARITLLLTDYPWLIVILVVVFCLLLAGVLLAMLQRHAAVRLQSNS